MIALLMSAIFLFPGDLVSGPQPGSKFGPYAFLIATGPNRGTSHCYVCETGADPAVIILARSNSESLGQFLQQLDRDFPKYEKVKLHAWVTFIGMSQPAKEPEITGWSKKLGLRHIPLGIFEDEAGPPSYHLNREADVTILFVKQNKVVHNLAYQQNGLTAAEVKKAMELVSGMVGK